MSRRSATRAAPRPPRPRYPHRCAGGCGRTARRLLRVRQLHTLQDLDGRALEQHVRTFMVPYCHRCTPEGP